MNSFVDINDKIIECGSVVAYIRPGSLIAKNIYPYISKGYIKSIGAVTSVIIDNDNSMQVVSNDQIIGL